MITLPIFGPSLPLLAKLTVWHFVAAMGVWAVFVASLKWIEWRRYRRSSETSDDAADQPAVSATFTRTRSAR